MNQIFEERLSAFVDGEPVDPAELLEALNQTGARELLLDFLALRIEARTVAERAVPGTLVARCSAGHRVPRFSRRWRTVAAALLIGLAGLGGWQLHAWNSAAGRAETSPPLPTGAREIHFAPGAWK